MDNQIVVGIHQPNFLPWLGYFYKIWQSDIFIFLDDVQFIKTGSSYTNRVTVNISGESSYLTIPIKRGSGVQQINETTFLNEKWKKKFIGTLQANYAKSPYFKENKDFIFELINFKADNLADYNIHAITSLSRKLHLNTEFKRSSAFHLQSGSTQRLIELIKAVHGNSYLSGEGGDNYQEHQDYKEESITLLYNKMPPFSYKQPKTQEFIKGLSVIDAIFNIGFENLRNNLFNESKKDI
jgi:hypothetical protein